MRPQLVLGTLVLALVGLAPCARAAPVRQLDVRSLVERSELIVIGKIVSVSEGEPESVNVEERTLNLRSCPAALLIQSVLKGDASSSTLSIRLYSDHSPLNPVRAVLKGQSGMFFLSRRDGSLSVTDLIYPFLPAIAGEYRASQPLDSVALGLGAVLLSEEQPLDARREALNALATVRTPLAYERMTAALNASTGDLQLLIAAALVGSGSTAGLPVVEQELLPSPAVSNEFIKRFAAALAGLHDPNAVPALTRLLDVPDVDIRIGAAEALRRSGSKQALPALARLLNDSNGLVQYHAVVGFGEILREDEWTPAYDTFQKDHVKYVVHWRKWVQENLP